MRRRIYNTVCVMCVLALLLTAGASDADRLPLGAAAVLAAVFASIFTAIAHLTLKNRSTGANSEAVGRITDGIPRFSVSMITDMEDECNAEYRCFS